jgi:hypothetical protein
MRTLRLWAATRDLEGSTNLLSLSINDIDFGEFVQHLADLATVGADPLRLAAAMPTKEKEKFDPYVPAALLDKANAVERIDVASARQAAWRVAHVGDGQSGKQTQHLVDPLVGRVESEEAVGLV